MVVFVIARTSYLAPFSSYRANGKEKPQINAFVLGNLKEYRHKLLLKLDSFDNITIADNMRLVSVSLT